MKLTLTRACLLMVTVTFLALTLTPSVRSKDVEVDIQGAKVLGQEQNWDGKPYWVFRGIRYGAAPTGNKRFAPTTRTDLPGTGTVDAREFGSRCYPIRGDPKADEDCLFLNIFCPPLGNNIGNTYPVVIYIHGGGNVFLNPEKADGGAFVTENQVVLVTFNFRLGPFGFLGLGSEDANVGLLDQRLLFDWVGRHCEHFWGDPDTITVWGLSGGAKDAAVHAATSAGNQYFGRVILSSGSVYGPSLYAWEAKTSAKRLAERVNCTRTTDAEILTCLRQVPAETLAEMAANMWPDHPMREILDFGWGAARDNNIIPNTFTTGTFSGEVLIGVNNNEGSVLYQHKWPTIQKNFREFSKTMFSKFKCEFIKKSLYQYYQKEAPLMAIEKVYKFYTEDDNCTNMSRAMEFYADQQYVAPAIQYLKKKISSGKSYLYYFNHNLKKNIKCDSLLQGARHTDEEAFFLGQVTDTNNYSDEERELSCLMRIYITNFAKTGNPNTPVDPGIQFPEYHDQSKPGSFLDITGGYPKVKASTSLLSKRMSLWLDRLPDLMNENGTTTCDVTNPECEAMERPC